MSYNEKIKDSFITRLNVYLFKIICHDELNNYNRFNEKQIKNFLSFDLEKNKDWVEYFVTEYYQQEVEKPLKNFIIHHNNNNLTPNKIYDKLKIAVDFYSPGETSDDKQVNTLFEKYKNEFKNILPKDFYDNLIENSKKTDSICAYCNISLKEINELSKNNKIRNKRSFRGYTLELDRKEPNYEYTPDNIVLSCYWCNNAKTDEFSYGEFVKIGKIIREVWDNRRDGKDLLTGT